MGGHIEYSDILRTCRVCGNTFRITNANSRHCSEKCRRKARVKSSMKWMAENPDKRRKHIENYRRKK